MVFSFIYPEVEIPTGFKLFSTKILQNQRESHLSINVIVNRGIVGDRMQQALDKSFEYDVFICHSSKDKPIIATLIEDFKKENITYWVDAEQIDFGDDVVQKIEEGLQKSRYVVPCLSKNSIISKWTRAEYSPILNSEFSG